MPFRLGGGKYIILILVGCESSITNAITNTKIRKHYYNHKNHVTRRKEETHEMPYKLNTPQGINGVQHNCGAH
jgi:hypothetical protein